MRDLSPASDAALANGSAALAILILIEFDGGNFSINTSRTDIPHDGVTYYGSGLVGSISEVVDKAREMAGMQITVNGIDPSIIAIALGQQVRGKQMWMHLAVLDSETHAVLDVDQIWAGQLSSMPISFQDNAAAITVVAEHRGVLFSRPRTLRYTDADQQRLYPGDRCLEFLVSQSQTQDIWPAAAYFRQ